MNRLLLLCEYPTLYGGERSMLATLGGVVEAGFSVQAAAVPTGPLAEALASLGVDVIPFATRGGSGHRLPQSVLREKLARLIRAQKPDLLHANSLAMGRLSGPVAAELGVPSLAHVRDIIKVSARAVADLNCHRRLLAVSHAARAYHVARGLDGEKTFTLHNGVDLRQFRPREPDGWLHRELQLPPGTLLAGTIGQIGLRKAQDVLVRAAMRIASRVTQLHWLVIGARHSDKPESRVFEAALRQAAAGPLAGRLHLLGTRDDVDRLLGELDLVVHPARQEPLGRVLLEAAACGRAVIATDTGGTREIFPPEARAARLVEPDDADALAAAMEELAADATLRASLGRAARRRVQTAFDARTSAAGLVAHYRAVLERG